MFLVFWLQIDFIFDQFNSLMQLDMTTIVILIATTLHVCFTAYTMLSRLARNGAIEKQDKLETIVWVTSLLLTTGTLVSYLTNAWIWSEEATLPLKLLEVGKLVVMFLSSLFGNVLYFGFKARFDAENRRFWNTYSTYDGVLFTGLVILAVVLTTLTSRMIPFTARNYFEYVALALTITFVGFVWYFGRSYHENRLLFYAVVTGYFLAELISGLELVFLLIPILRTQFAELGIDASRFQFMTTVIYGHLLFLGFWLAHSFYQEHKQATKAK